MKKNIGQAVSDSMIDGKASIIPTIITCVY